jgi:hypothetical protein
MRKPHNKALGFVVLAGLHPLESGRVPPQSLQVVVLARARLKQMHHHIAVVHQHPLRLGKALIAQGGATVLLEELFDTFGQSLHMGPRSARGDHEEVGDYEKIADFEENDVGSLLVGDGVGCEPGSGGCVYGWNLLDSTRINLDRYNVSSI